MIDESTIRRIVMASNRYPNRVGCELDDLLQEARIAVWQKGKAQWGVAKAFRRYGPVPETNRKNGVVAHERPRRKEFREKLGNDNNGTIVDIPSWLVTTELECDIDVQLFNRAVSVALSSLIPSQKEVLLSDTPDEEIAKRDGCSTSAVRMRRTKALRALKRHPALASILSELHTTFT